jgi:hypothetical protein
MARALDGLDFMSDPIPAISESEAADLIAEIYADIRRVYMVGVVNLIWRHLATIPGGLPWAWSIIRPLYVNGTVGREAAALRAALSLPQLPLWPTAALISVGLQDEDIAGIRRVLAAGPAGFGADESTLPWLKLVKTKMSSTAPEPGREAKFRGMKLALNPTATCWAAATVLGPALGSTPTSGVM